MRFAGSPERTLALEEWRGSERRDRGFGALVRRARDESRPIRAGSDIAGDAEDRLEDASGRGRVVGAVADPEALGTCLRVARRLRQARADASTVRRGQRGELASCYLESDGFGGSERPGAPRITYNQ